MVHLLHRTMMAPTAPDGSAPFKDTFNKDQGWFSNDFLGIGQGLFMLMIDNYQSGHVWHMFMKNKFVQEGLRVAGFR